MRPHIRLEPGKCQVSLGCSARLSPLPSLGFRHLPKWWSEERKG